MTTKNLKKIFKATLLACALSTSMPLFATPTDQVVAIVGKSVILKSDLEQGVADFTRQLSAQKQELPPQNILETQVLNQLIIQNAQLELVKRYGIQADEKALNEAVLKVAKQSGSNTLEAFQQKVDKSAPGTYEALRARIAQDIAMQRLRQQQVMSRIKISDQDVDNFLKSPEGQAIVGGQVHLIHLRVSGDVPSAQLNQIANQVKVALNQSNDHKAIEKQFNKDGITITASDTGYRPISEIPAELSTRVSLIQPGQTTDLIRVKDGVHILKLLDRKSNDQKALVPQFQTRHILIKTSEVVTPENAKQIIDNLYERINAGQDFATLAATYSNDPGTARNGGSLGWVTPGTMVPEFDKTMQESAIGKLSKPFQTQFGWHILQVTDKREQDMTKEYQRNMARQVLGERQFETELDSWLRELRVNTYVEIKDPNLK